MKAYIAGNPLEKRLRKRAKANVNPMSVDKDLK